MKIAKKSHLYTPAEKGLLALGGLLALSLTFVFVTELPAMRRAVRIMRM